MSRQQYARQLLNNNIRAYNLLKDVQGKRISKFLGYYSLSFNDRELIDDQECPLIMLMPINGTILQKSPAVKFPSLNPQKVRENVLETVDMLHQKNIFFPTLDLCKFLISPSDMNPKAIGFSSSFDGMQYETEERRKRHVELCIAMLKDKLDKLGYVE